MASLLRSWMMRIEGRRDLDRARHELPYMAQVERRIQRWRKELEPAWREYTRTISTPEMAVALEIAAILRALCETLRPAAALDLGSGFSSYVLRSYQKSAAHAVRVKSVDDDERWLGATREYLRAQRVGQDEIGGLALLGPGDVGAYDLVFHDLGSMATRLERLPQALECARPDSGVVLLDDCHKKDYRVAALDVLRSRGLPRYSLRELGCDRFGRFDVLVTPAAQSASVSAS